MVSFRQILLFPSRMWSCKGSGGCAWASPTSGDAVAQRPIPESCAACSGAPRASCFNNVSCLQYHQMKMFLHLPSLLAFRRFATVCEGCQDVLVTPRKVTIAPEAGD